MREIKFRGKSYEIPNNDWVYGSVCNPNTEYPHITTEHYCSYPVNFKTLGQYTGLKDKNGKEIFEGDILIEDADFIKMFIAYDESRACFVNANAGINLSEGDPLCDIFNSKECEIIGNIHDNPELLEEKKLK